MQQKTRVKAFWVKWVNCVHSWEGIRFTYQSILHWESASNLVSLCSTVSKAWLFGVETASWACQRSARWSAWYAMVTSRNRIVSMPEICLLNCLICYGDCSRNSIVLLYSLPARIENWKLVLSYVNVTLIFYQSILSKICKWMQTRNLQMRYRVQQYAVLSDKEAKFVDE